MASNDKNIQTTSTKLKDSDVLKAMIDSARSIFKDKYKPLQLSWYVQHKVRSNRAQCWEYIKEINEDHPFSSSNLTHQCCFKTGEKEVFDNDKKTVVPSYCYQPLKIPKNKNDTYLTKKAEDHLRSHGWRTSLKRKSEQEQVEKKLKEEQKKPSTLSIEEGDCYSCPKKQ